jgi:predicted transcriptional regulator
MADKNLILDRGSKSMAIVITLTPEEEAKLHRKAARQGKDVAIVAAELLASALEWEAQDYEEAIAGIQGGLDDFEAGRSRSFDEFAEEQRRKYNLPNNP